MIGKRLTIPTSGPRAPLAESARACDRWLLGLVARLATDTEDFCILRSSPVPTFPKLLLLPDAFPFSLSVVAANTGLLMA